jgi:DNA-binding NarL/FixJ family response regulator
VRSTLEQHPRSEVAGEAEDGSDAIEEAHRLKPDVVVLNVSMPVLNGPETAIVMLSSSVDQRFAEEAKKIGARAHVAKTKAGEAVCVTFCVNRREIVVNKFTSEEGPSLLVLTRKQLHLYEVWNPK